MGIFSSLLSFVIVIGAGYATIKYVVPYLQKEIGATATTPSEDTSSSVVNDIADAAGLDVPATTEEPAATEEPKKTSKKKKPPYDPSKGMAGKGESRKKKVVLKQLRKNFVLLIIMRMSIIRYGRS